MVDDDTLVIRRDPLIEAEIGGEIMGLSIDRGLCFGFNATAAELWRMLQSPQTLGALCDGMMAGHDVDRATCRADVGAALSTMAEHGLVSLTSAGG